MTEEEIKLNDVEDTFEGLVLEDVQEDRHTLNLVTSLSVEDDVMVSGSTQEGAVTEDVKPSDAEERHRDTSELEEEAGVTTLINETGGGEEMSKEGIKTPEDDRDRPASLDPRVPDGQSPRPLEESALINSPDAKDELQEESDRLRKLNVQLQIQIAEHLSRNAGDDEQPTRSRDISDQEQLQKYMDLIESLEREHQRRSNVHQQRIEELCRQSQEKLEQVEREIRSFALVKNEAAVKALNGKVGRQETLEEVEKLLADERKKEDELACVRLNNIKLKNEVCKLEAAFHSQQQLADGLLLMDFEQLKTDNKTFKDKFKERGEELLRLKNKIACSVQGITHLKEKMHFMQTENLSKRTQLAEADALLAHKRDVLTRTRQARDNLRTDNFKLQQRCGLLGNATLLRDFEERVDTSQGLQQRLEMLKRRHAELVLKCAGVKLKIERSKPEYK